MKNIALYGYGKSGKYIADKAEQCGVDVRYIIDKDAKNIRKQGICRRNVYTLEEVEDTRDYHEIEGIVVTIENGDIAEDVFRKLYGENKKLGYVTKSMVEHTSFNLDKIVWLRNKIFFSRIVVHLMDSCNLKCKGCSHFANIFPDGQCCEKEILLADFIKINKYVYPYSVCLLGGGATS